MSNKGTGAKGRFRARTGLLGEGRGVHGDADPLAQPRHGRAAPMDPRAWERSSAARSVTSLFSAGCRSPGPHGAPPPPPSDIYQTQHLNLSDNMMHQHSSTYNNVQSLSEWGWGAPCGQDICLLQAEPVKLGSADATGCAI